MDLLENRKGNLIPETMPQVIGGKAVVCETHYLRFNDNNSHLVNLSILYIMDAFVCDPCDCLYCSSGVLLVKLFVDKCGGVTIVLLDGVAYLALYVWYFVECHTITEPYAVGVSVNTYIVYQWVGDAVEELDGFYTLEYVDNWVASGEYVPCLGFLVKVGAYFDDRVFGM